MDKVNLAQKLSLFTDQFSPKIVGEVNDAYVKLVKLQGDFVWHHHDEEDALFFVVKGALRMKVRRERRRARVHGPARGIHHHPARGGALSLCRRRNACDAAGAEEHAEHREPAQ
jgi:hypothetical protein